MRVERSCERWFILSALHGLVEPDRVLEPYERTLTTASPSQRRAWSERVLGQIEATFGTDLSGHRFEAHAGRAYLSLESLARDLGVDRKTVGHHLRILQDLMLVRIHPPWHSNLSHREVKTPKVYVTDTAMMTALIGSSADRIATDPGVAGMAFETFVTMEMVKLSSWSASSPRLFHYRDRDGREVDVVLERADGSIVGIEVKAAATVVSADFRGLAYLRDKLGGRFVRGVVLYAGTRALPFGERLSALPLSCFWS